MLSQVIKKCRSEKSKIMGQGSCVDTATAKNVPVKLILDYFDLFVTAARVKCSASVFFIRFIMFL